MKTNANEQSAVWLAAFNEGLSRGEAAFGASHRSAVDYAESYAHLVEAEHMKATPAAEDDEPKQKEGDATSAGWTKAFARGPDSGGDDAGGRNEAAKVGWAKAFARTAD